MKETQRSSARHLSVPCCVFVELRCCIQGPEEPGGAAVHEDKEAGGGAEQPHSDGGGDYTTALKDGF